MHTALLSSELYCEFTRKEVGLVQGLYKPLRRREFGRAGRAAALIACRSSAAGRAELQEALFHGVPTVPTGEEGM